MDNHQNKYESANPHGDDDHAALDEPHPLSPAYKKAEDKVQPVQEEAAKIEE